MDGGIRSGTDIYKCIELGAKCVFIGRPVIYSVAVGGKEEIDKMFKILH